MYICMHVVCVYTLYEYIYIHVCLYDILTVCTVDLSGIIGGGFVHKLCY